MIPKRCAQSTGRTKKMTISTVKKVGVVVLVVFIFQKSFIQIDKNNRKNINIKIKINIIRGKNLDIFLKIERRHM